MAFKDILLHLSSYPNPTPQTVIAVAVEIAKSFGARISAAISVIEIADPSNILSRKLTDIAEVIAAENNASSKFSKALSDEFTAATSHQEPKGDTKFLVFHNRLQSTDLIRLARLHDLAIMPVSFDIDTRVIAHDLIFGSGRPVLLIPENAATGLFDNIVMAWDGSRAAARAVADALPFLERAREVRIVHITGDKPPKADSTVDALKSHLNVHGIIASTDSEPAAGEGAGEALVRYCGRHGVDLLVMGAYGHSRMRDLVVGGATKSLVAVTPLPVLLSH